MVGKTFDHLTVTRLRYVRRGRCVDLMADCVCKCGKTIVTRVSGIVNKTTRSCGCRKMKHGLAHTKLYAVWLNMRNRCYNENVRAYARYGARGITVCDEWKDEFIPFMRWALSHGWNESLQIDRIDNNGQYCPDNCRFVTRSENVRNREVSEKITFNGETHHIVEWAKILGVSVTALHNRRVRGWSKDKIFTVPVKKAEEERLITYKGETMNMQQWDKRFNLPRGTVRNRTRLGWRFEDIVSRPMRKDRRRESNI